MEGTGMADHKMMRRMARVGGLMAIVGYGLVGAWPLHAASGATDSTIAVNAGVVLGRIPRTAYGMNDAIWDGNALNPAANRLMQQAGVSLMRLGGGATADNYHWELNQINQNRSFPGHSDANGPGYIPSGNSYLSLAQTAEQYGMRPLIVVNYGSNATMSGPGDPSADGANWVRDANVTHGLGITYWVIGNENYGGGYYDYSHWETNLHNDRTPDQYARDVVTYAAAMKAVDPAIKIGAALETPGYYPWGAGTSQYQSPSAYANAGVGPAGHEWNSHVLQGACHSLDFVDVHWYPTNSIVGSTDADLLNAVRQRDPAMQSGPGTFNGIAGMVAEVRHELAAFCGARAWRMQIFIGETNTGNSGPQYNNIADALFAPDALMTWLENGVANVSWWNLHNGLLSRSATPGVETSAYNIADIGVLSSGAGQPCPPSPSSTTCEPPVDTPFPVYYGLRMAALTGSPGDTMMSSTVSGPQIAVHAVKQANGHLALLLINKDPGNSTTAAISLTGYTPALTATTYSYGRAQAINAASGVVVGLLSGVGPSFTVTIAPYSMITLVLTPAAASTQATAISDQADTAAQAPATATSTVAPATATMPDTPVPPPSATAAPSAQQRGAP